MKNINIFMRELNNKKVSTLFFFFFGWLKAFKNLFPWPQLNGLNKSNFHTQQWFSNNIFHQDKGKALVIININSLFYLIKTNLVISIGTMLEWVI